MSIDVFFFVMSPLEINKINKKQVWLNQKYLWLNLLYQKRERHQREDQRDEYKYSKILETKHFRNGFFRKESQIKFQMSKNNFKGWLIKLKDSKIFYRIIYDKI